MHVVIYLPVSFYSAIASTIVETLQAVNQVSGRRAFSFEFVSWNIHARSKSGITYPVKPRPSRKMDVLILLTGVGTNVLESISTLEEETERARPLVLLAERQGALIASTCGAAYILAKLGLLDKRRATISWWLTKAVKKEFPSVRWEPSRIVVRDGSLYTAGAAFAGLELISKLVIDLGFAKEERMIRKLMVLPPARESQDPYEVQGLEESTSFEKRIRRLAKGNLPDLCLSFLATKLNISSRSLSRRFLEELQMTPGKWIQEQRLEAARVLLESTRLSISEIGFRVGYHDVASFGRLFVKTTGLTPGEFRKELRPASDSR